MMHRLLQIVEGTPIKPAWQIGLGVGMLLAIGMELQHTVAVVLAIRLMLARAAVGKHTVGSMPMSRGSWMAMTGSTVGSMQVAHQEVPGALGAIGPPRYTDHLPSIRCPTHCSC